MRGARPLKRVLRRPKPGSGRLRGRTAALLEPRRPPGAARASLFFDAFPRFYETSRTGVVPARLNLRYEAICAENADVFAGARVLDLASHDGRWLLAALRTGAREVVGIEARDDVVRRARANLGEYAPAAAWELRTGDIFEVLAEEALEADVVLCLGFLYHTVRYAELMRRIRDVGPRHLIVVTEVIARRRKPFVHLRAERIDQPRSAVEDFSHDGKTVVGRPSLAALELMLETYGFAIERFSDWGALLRDNSASTGLADYASGRRVTARCVSRG